MSGNHYSKQVAALEQVLRGKLSQLSLLSEENKVLRQRERALQAYQASLAGGVRATEKVLREASFTSQHSQHSQGRHSDTLSGEDGSTTTSCSEGCQVSGRSLSFSDGQALLQKIDEREVVVQQVLLEIGGCDEDAYNSLYTTQLLRSATAQPARTATILAMTIPQRLAYVTKCVERFALLLPKYDRIGQSTRGVPVKQQLDRLVDELSEKALTFGLLDPPSTHLSECMINMETSQPEGYPEGWWDAVVEALELTEGQKATLKVCYDKVKPNKDALTAQHTALAARLAQLQSSQHSKQRAFEHGAEEVYSWVHPGAGAGGPTACCARASPKGVLLAGQGLRTQQLKERQPMQMQMQMQTQQQEAGTKQLCSKGSADPLSLNMLEAELDAELASASDPDLLADLLTRSLEEAGRAAVSDGCEICDDSYDSLTWQQAIGPDTKPPAAAAIVAADASLQQHPQQEQRHVHFALPQAQQDALQSHARATASWRANPTSRLQQDFLRQFGAQFGAAGGQSTGAGASCAAVASSTLVVAVKADPEVYHDAMDEQLDVDQLRVLSMSSATAVPVATSGNAGGSNSCKKAWLPGMQQQASCSGSSSSTATVAAAMPLLSREEVAAAVDDADAFGGGAMRVLNSVIARSSSQCQRDLLVQLGSREQQQIEQELDRITAQLKMQQYCLALHLHNVLTKKQIALQYLHCFPFIPEAFSLFEALEATWSGHTNM